MLTILVPTRGRPHRVRPMLNAWYATGAFDDGAELVFVIDKDDPNLGQYEGEIKRDARYGSGIYRRVAPEWQPLVPKLNHAARLYSFDDGHIGFMGDDHEPRTGGWARIVREALAETPGIVSSPDGLRTDDLPTWWAMSADIVQTLGYMVPGGMEHLYCDNAVRDLARGAGIYRWLDDVLIEHMHPMAGKAAVDEGYERVNSATRYAEDQAAYHVWQYARMRTDIGRIKALKETPRGE